MVGINVNKISEVLYDRSEQQGSFNRSTEYIKIIDEERSTVPPSFDAQQCNTQDGNFVPNVLLDFDIEQKISKGAKTFLNDPSTLLKQNEEYEDQGPMSNVKLNTDNQKDVSKDDLPILDAYPVTDKQHRDAFEIETLSSNLVCPTYQKDSNGDTVCKKVDDTINEIWTADHNISGTIMADKSFESKTNLGLPLGLHDNRFSDDKSIQRDMVEEPNEEPTKSLEGESATSGLIHSLETITNPGIITKLKRFFGVSKEVKEVNISISQDELWKRFLKVGKKKLHERQIAPVMIWDFGGQDIFYSTHQTFLSYRAIYLIVLNGSRSLDDPCEFDQYVPGKSGPKTARGMIILNRILLEY